MKQRIYFLMILIIAGIIACNKDSDSSIPDTSSNINVFLAVPDQQYDVVIDSTSIGNELGYGESTGYHAFIAKRYTLFIYKTGTRTAPVAGGEISLRNGHFYSVFLSRNHSDTVLQLLAVEDNLAPSRANFGKVRFINLSDTYINPATRLTLDMYVDTLRYFRRQGYLAATEFLEVPVGLHPLKIQYQDSSKVLAGSNTPDFEVKDQKQYTVIAYGKNALKADSFKITTFVH